ncbi:hypothetical protein Pmani_002035 [Petrolisthes manimaculis]|uniref:Uncharacterized protein n=1 Tax=Petrolisthes manimaculis TaxID=1843537 RepID=A0AAE1QJ63_9EUCA|nr:hypothetical protein Pmani_002035 [Petrolisthes manimaculis]
MERRMSNNPAILAERARIVWLWLGGASAKSISQQTGASLSVVYRWIHRWQEEGSVRTRPYHRRLRRLRWNDSHRLSTPGIINLPSTLTRTVRPQATLSLTSEQPSPLSMAQATLATPNSSFERQFHYPVISDFSFQDYPCSKMIQNSVYQAPWQPTIPLY